MTEEDYNVISTADFVNILKKRVKKDWDAVVGITGEEGSGKSTLASLLVYDGCIADGYTHEEALQKFIEYTIFSPNQERVQEQITKSERYSIINADEAIKILYKQNWATPIQKFLNMFYALCRQENKISLLCMPRFLDFNEFFRNHRIKFWIHVIDRGTGLIFERDWFPSSDDPWLLKEAMKYNKSLYFRRKTGDFNTHQKIQALSKLKNFIGVIKFDDLSTDLKKVYKDGKSKFAYDDLEEQVKQNEEFAPGARADRYKKQMIKIAKELNERGILQKDIARIFGASKNTINTYVNTKLQDSEGPLLLNKLSGEDNFDDS